MFTIQKYTKEIKYLFIYITISITLTTILTYYYNYELLYLISKPLIDSNSIKNNNKFNFIFTDLFEAFQTYLFLSITSSFIINIPYILWNIWKFMIKGLYYTENKILIKITLWLAIYIITLNCIFYKILLPIILSFLLQFETIIDYNPFDLQMQLKLKEYFKIFTKLIFLYNFILLAPFILIFYRNIKWIYYKKYIYLITMIIISIITPPDILSLLILIIPIILALEFTHIIKRIDY